MARVDTLTNFLTDVAGAIKTKKGNTTPILASDFDTEIANLPSGGGIDLNKGIRFGYSGFSTMPSEILNANWSSARSGESLFANCSFTTMPYVDTSNMTIMQFMFTDCWALETVPELDTSSCTIMDGIFSGCTNLTNESLNNILAMCANVNSNYSAGKTLLDIGLDYEQAQKCTGLSNYQDFLNAGWALGDYEEPEE